MAACESPSQDADSVEALDALVPGLGDALVDLIDALHDRTDDLGLAGTDTLARLARRLTAAWPTTAPADRPLALLDALRDLVKPVRDR